MPFAAIEIQNRRPASDRGSPFYIRVSRKSLRLIDALASSSWGTSSFDSLNSCAPKEWVILGEYAR